jgi:hypothetical protein
MADSTLTYALCSRSSTTSFFSPSYPWVSLTNRYGVRACMITVPHHAIGEIPATLSWCASFRIYTLLDWRFSIISIRRRQTNNSLCIEFPFCFVGPTIDSCLLCCDPSYLYGYTRSIVRKNSCVLVEALNHKLRHWGAICHCVSISWEIRRVFFEGLVIRRSCKYSIGRRSWLRLPYWPSRACD